MDKTLMYALTGVFIVAVMYFMYIRPTKKNETNQFDKLQSLKKGDTVITMGGFYATVVEIKEAEAMVELIPSGTQCKISPQAIAVFPSDIAKSEKGIELRAEAAKKRQDKEQMKAEAKAEAEEKVKAWRAGKTKTDAEEKAEAEKAEAEKATEENKD